MTLYTVMDDNQPTTDQVRVRETHIGKGVFAERNYPVKSIIGQITGDLINDPNHGSAYAIEIDAVSQMEPHAPFRFLNHCCDPNCEFDFLTEESEGRNDKNLYVIALRNIYAGEQLTIEYNWAATSAIPCECGTSNCRGWIVCPWELDQVGNDQVFESELQAEVQKTVSLSMASADSLASSDTPETLNSLDSPTELASTIAEDALGVFESYLE